MPYPDNDMIFSMPDKVMSERVHMSSEGTAFMRVMWAMQMTPLGTRLDRDDWALITGECGDAANTAYLTRLATF
jgi:hypothetical protein